MPAWVEEFLALNDLEDADHLTAGTTVKIPGTARSTGSSSSTTTPSTVSTQSSAGGSRPYTVQSGDTLYGIAANLNVPGEKLYEWVQATLALNDMDGGDALVVGKTIQVSTKNVPVPKPITSAYTVKSGDTLGEIASKTGVPDTGYIGWLALVLELNSLESANLLREGQVLQLPVTSGGGASSTSSTPASSNNSGPSATSQNVSLTRTSTQSTTSYVVKSGDTLEAIGIAQKVPDTQLRQWIEDVRKLNKLGDDAFIMEGQKLDLPSLSVAPPPAASTSTNNSTTTSADPPRPPSSASSVSSTWTPNGTTTTSTPSSSTNTTTTSPALQNAPRSMTGCFYVIKTEDTLSGIAKKVGVESGKVDGWIAQVKDMNGVDFKVMPVGTAIQMPC